MTLASQTYLRWLFEQESTRQDNIATFRDYYDGDHNVKLTQRQEEYLELNGGDVRFCLNVCPVVVDSAADRMNVTGFKVTKPPSLQAKEQNAGATSEEDMTADDKTPEQEWADVLNEWWTDNRCDGKQRMVYKSALRDGDAYMIVDWDEDKQRPRFNFQPAFTSYGENDANGQGVKMHYAEDGTVYCASKRWKVDRVEDGRVMVRKRANLYYADRVEKWYSDSDATDADWQPYNEDGPAVTPWVDNEGNPLGVPVAHFRNCEVGYTGGTSELVSVIPLQDAVNKLLVDMLNQADFESYGVYYQIGGERPEGSIYPGVMIWVPDPETQLGRIEAAGQSHFIEDVDAAIRWVASVTRTPQYMFYPTGQMPSGEALKTAEAGLVAKVQDRQVGFGNAWEDVMKMAIKLQNTFGDGIDIPEGALISCMWDDVSTQTREEQQARADFMVANGYAKEALRIMGYDDAEIEQLEREKQDAQDQMADMGMLLAQSARAKFEQGGAFGGNRMPMQQQGPKPQGLGNGAAGKT